MNGFVGIWLVGEEMKCFDRLLGARSTQKLVEIHNNEGWDRILHPLQLLAHNMSLTLTGPKITQNRHVQTKKGFVNQNFFLGLAKMLNKNKSKMLS